jgi:hypothetical protein
MTRKLIFSTGEHNRINAGSGSKLRFIGIIRRSFQLKPGKVRIEQTNPALTFRCKDLASNREKAPAPYLTELQGVYTSANPEAQKKTL